ncbi:MAG TPA: cell division protein FtsZ [Bacilli bacterium]
MLYFYRFTGGNALETEKMVEQLAALREKSLLLFGIFRFPYRFEGKKRLQTAIRQYYRMQEMCDGITYFYADGMLEMLEPGTSIIKANEIFSAMEEEIINGLETIVEIPGEMNIDLHDIESFMHAKKGPFFLHTIEGTVFDEPLKYLLAKPYLPHDFAEGQQMIVNIGYSKDVNMDAYRQINLRLHDLFHKADLFKMGTYCIDEPGQRIKITLLLNGISDPYPRPEKPRLLSLQPFSAKSKWQTLLRAMRNPHAANRKAQP